MTNTADPRTITRGADRWLTDSRVYNLVWLGRWIERAQDDCPGGAMGGGAGFCR